MRNMVFAAAVAAVFGMGIASAADLSGGVKDTMFSEPAVVWSGGYVGISGGGGIMMTNSGKLAQIFATTSQPAAIFKEPAVLLAGPWATTGRSATWCLAWKAILVGLT